MMGVIFDLCIQWSYRLKGDYRKVRSLSRLLVNSKKDLLYGICVVTLLNSGKKTAGFDNKVYLTDAERM